MIQWPRWVKIYSVVVAIPMIPIALLVAVWLVQSRFDGLLRDDALVGAILLTVSFVAAFAVGAWLFLIGAKRVWQQWPEALMFAATGHLMVALPAAVFIGALYSSDSRTFMVDIDNAVADGTFSRELILIAWTVIHVYAALVVGLADGTLWPDDLK